MRPAHIGALLAALAAACAAWAAPAEPDALALAVGPHDVASLGPRPQDVLEALPAPPEKAVLQTKYYGTVTVDHRAHLARHASCKTCHGTGPVTKLALTPKVAHERCQGCHREQQRGPTDCRGCHVLPPPPEPVLTKAPAAADKAGAGPEVASALAGAAAATATALPPPPPPPASGSADGQPPPLDGRSVALALAAGTGVGPSVRFNTQYDQLVMTYAVERLATSSEARTLGLIGGGVAGAITPRLGWAAEALGGFDAIEKPSMGFLPALGARASLEWLPPGVRGMRVTASANVVTDLLRTERYGRDVGGTSAFVTVGTAFGLPGR